MSTSRCRPERPTSSACCAALSLPHTARRRSTASSNCSARRCAGPRQEGGERLTPRKAEQRARLQPQGAIRRAEGRTRRRSRTSLRCNLERIRTEAHGARRRCAVLAAIHHRQHPARHRRYGIGKHRRADRSRLAAPEGLVFSTSRSSVVDNWRSCGPSRIVAALCFHGDRIGPVEARLVLRVRCGEHVFADGGGSVPATAHWPLMPWLLNACWQ